MVEITGLPAAASVPDTAEFAIYDDLLPSNKTVKATRAQLLNGVARQDGDHNFGTVEIDELTAGITALTFASTAVLTNIFRGTQSIAVGTLAAGATEDQTMTLTGIATTDYLLGPTFASGLPAGLLFNAWISGANTITFRFTNTIGTSITGASYTAEAVALRF